MSQTIRDAEEGNESAIEFLNSAPKMSKIDKWVWQMFNRLNSERPSSMSGISKIPVTKIFEYAGHLGLDERATDLLHYVIPILDSHQCDIASERMKKENARRSKKK
ncbi:phage tail assembly chaperone [Brevundimonas olei]|uniref:phage tail assembly chaperone n=1 Tax=Brevundimonas olei TaxID=657642 RepID=UPI0031E3AB2E